MHSSNIRLNIRLNVNLNQLWPLRLRRSRAQKLPDIIDKNSNYNTVL